MLLSKCLLSLLIATVPISQCGRIVVPAGGGSVVRPAAPAAPAAPGARPLAPGATQILIDPEDEQDSWSDVVWAISKDAAENICRSRASQATNREVIVQFSEAIQITKQPNGANKLGFECWFTSFTKSYADDRSTDD